MKIVIVSLDFLPDTGGVQRYLYELWNRVGQLHDVVVITPVKGELPPDSSLTKIEIESGKFTRFTQEIKRQSADYVVVGHAHPQLLLSAFLTAPTRFLTMTYGNDFLAGQLHWHTPVFNWMLRKSSPLITITKATADKLAEIGCKDSTIIYPGTDGSVFLPPVTKLTTPSLLTVGRLVSRKGIDKVLEALPSLLIKYPDLTYSIVGEGEDLERLQQLVTELEIEASINFLGRISFEELQSLYQQSTLFIMPSREEKAVGSIEGFGIVYLEASASGIPVIAGRSGGAVEAVQEGITGFLVDPLDSADIAEKIDRLLGDPSLCEQLGQNGRKWVVEEMNWDRSAEKLVKLLAGVQE